VSLAHHIIAGSFQGEEVMSPVLKRSIVIAGHKTSISLEDEFWNSFKEIAGERGMTVAAMIGAIDGGFMQAVDNWAAQALAIMLRENPYSDDLDAKMKVAWARFL
jgi:predicted DNA-binding ribbon-helix-helix protein